MPRCWEYKAVRDLGSRARRKIPPMPVTRAMLPPCNESLVRGLLCRAIFAPGVGDACDEPLAVFADEVEEIGSAVVDLAVDEVVERSPYDREVVVDADQRIVNLLFVVGCTGPSRALGEGVERHLGGYAVAH